MLTVNALGTIVGPTITTVKRVEMLNIVIESLLGELPSILFESEIGKDSEPEPIGVGHTDSR